MAGRVGGIIQVIVNGERQQAKGSWTYNLGIPEREAVVGMDGVHGYKESPRVPFIEGEITDRGDLDLAQLASMTDGTVVLSLANGKTVTLNDAWAAGEWTGNTEEGNIPARFEGMSAQET
jgi:hypothetical protein